MGTGVGTKSFTNSATPSSAQGHGPQRTVVAHDRVALWLELAVMCFVQQLRIWQHTLSAERLLPRCSMAPNVNTETDLEQSLAFEVPACL